MLSTAFRPDHQGKVCDIYDRGDCLLLIASDRAGISDVILSQIIPGAGESFAAISEPASPRIG